MTNKEKATAWYEELHKLMWAIVWDYVNHDRWLLEPGELFAELSAELVKIVYRYDDGSRDHDEVKRILVTSLRNRCTDLILMSYYTHRKVEDSMLSLDVDSDCAGYGEDYAIKGVGVVDPPYFDLEGMLRALSGDGQKLALEVIDPSERTLRFLELFIARKRAAGPKNHWKFKITPLLMRRALGWDKARLDNAWEEIGDVLECI